MRNQNEERVFNQCLFYRVSLLNFTTHFETITQKKLRLYTMQNNSPIFTKETKNTCDSRQLGRV